MTTAELDIRVLDADTDANGDPTTFRLPLDQFAYQRDEDPCHLNEFNDSMLVDRDWVVLAGAETISADELMGNVAPLASDAAESTRSALSDGMQELMRNADQMAWLREHADNIPDSAIQEMVRIASPVAAGNFDERAFDAPDTFDLAREKYPHVSSGRGPQQCLGKHVATLEMKILLEELLMRTSDIKAAGDIEYVQDTYSRGAYQLSITITGK